MFLLLQVPHHHLQQLFPPPAALGAQENLPEPNAEPTDLRGRGSRSSLLTASATMEEINSKQIKSNFIDLALPLSRNLTQIASQKKANTYSGTHSSYARHTAHSSIRTKSVK